MKSQFCLTCERFAPDVEFINGKKYNLCVGKIPRDDGHGRDWLGRRYFNSDGEWTRAFCKRQKVLYVRKATNIPVFFDPLRQIPKDCLFKMERQIIEK